MVVSIQDVSAVERRAVLIPILTQSVCAVTSRVAIGIVTRLIYKIIEKY